MQCLTCHKGGMHRAVVGTWLHRLERSCRRSAQLQQSLRCNLTHMCAMPRLELANEQTTIKTLIAIQFYPGKAFQGSAMKKPTHLVARFRLKNASHYSFPHALCNSCVVGGGHFLCECTETLHRRSGAHMEFGPVLICWFMLYCTGLTNDGTISRLTKCVLRTVNVIDEKHSLCQCIEGLLLETAAHLLLLGFWLQIFHQSCLPNRYQDAIHATTNGSVQGRQSVSLSSTCIDWFKCDHLRS